MRPSLPMWRGWLAPCLTGFGVPAMLPRWLGMGPRPYARPEPPGQIATLVLPADTAWDEAPGPADPLPIPARSVPQPEAIEAARTALASGEPCVLLMNGQALRAPALAQAARVAEASGARLFRPSGCLRAGRACRLRSVFLTLASRPLGPRGDGAPHSGGDSPSRVLLCLPGQAQLLVPEGCSVHSLVVSKGIRWPPLRRWLMPLTRRPRRAQCGRPGQGPGRGP